MKSALAVFPLLAKGGPKRAFCGRDLGPFLEAVCVITSTKGLQNTYPVSEDPKMRPKNPFQAENGPKWVQKNYFVGGAKASLRVHRLPLMLH